MPTNKTIVTKVEPSVAGEKPGIEVLASTGHNRGIRSFSGHSIPITVEKSWGREIIYHNHDDLYCSKMLIIDPNKYCSLHFHMDKHETMVVIAGTLHIEYCIDKKLKTAIVNTWESFVIAPGFPHRLRAGQEELRLIESSTPSYDNDSIRIY